MNYNIELDNFTGPFELLLNLIKTDEIDIYNIPINKITKDYILAIDKLKIPAVLVADFIYFASMLLEIKSQLLLPDSSLEKITEEDIDDPRSLLLKRLLVYKDIKENTSELSEKYYLNITKTFTDEIVLDIKLDREKLLNIKYDITKLKQAYKNVLAIESRFIEEDYYLKFELKHYSVKKKQSYIKELLDKMNILDFYTITENKPKGEKIATLLALLKLQQEQSVKLTQQKPFENIFVEGKNEN